MAPPPDRRGPRPGDHLRALDIAALLTGLVVGVSLLLAILEPARTALFTPYLMALGVLIGAWCMSLRRLSLRCMSLRRLSQGGH